MLTPCYTSADPVLPPVLTHDYLRASTTGVCKMSTTVGYRRAFQAVKRAYEDAVKEYRDVRESNEVTHAIRSAYVRLTMTQEQIFGRLYETEFRRYESHVRRVDACLQAIQTLDSLQANSARAALYRLRAVMQTAFFKMFDYDDNDFIDLEEMTMFLSERFRRAYVADSDIQQRMGASYQQLAEVTAEQAFQEAHPRVNDSMSLEEFNAWYATSDDSDGAKVFVKGGGRFGNVPSWLEQRLEALDFNLEAMDVDFRW